MELKSDIIVTTCDLKDDYEVICPVYAQVNNHTLGNFSDLRNKYRALMQKKYEEGTAKQAEYKKGSILYALFAPVSDAGNLSGSREFEEAFFYAIEELKDRAYNLGADAVIGMRQDIDLDTGGISHFYLQMYGTAVRRKVKYFINSNNEKIDVSNDDNERLKAEKIIQDYKTLYDSGILSEDEFKQKIKQLKGE